MFGAKISRVFKLKRRRGKKTEPKQVPGRTSSKFYATRTNLFPERFQ